VRFEDGRAIANATVVYGSYPDRYETRTDAQGAFAIPAVATGREAVIFVDAPTGGRPPFERTTVSQRLEIAANQARVDVSITVPPPLPATGVQIINCPRGQAADPTTPIPYALRTCGRITQSEQLAFCPLLEAYRRSGGVQQLTPVNVVDLQVNPDGAEARASVQVPAPGTYTFVLSYTPFVYAQKELEIDTSDPVPMAFVPPDPWPSAVIVAVDRVGRPAPDLEVAFPNWVSAADPFDGLTDRNGAMTIDCFNLDPVPAFVASELGCFEGAVRLRQTGANLVLQSCEGF
jgi:hypothetical protein